MNDSNPKQLAEQGNAAYQRGEYAEAARLFGAAAYAHQTQDEALLAAEMANNQSVASLQAGDAQAALDAVAGTEEIFANAKDAKREGMAAGNRAAALDALGRLEEAEAAYVRCAELLKQAGELELRAQVMKSLSGLQLRSGRQLEALASMQAGVEGLEKPGLKDRIVKSLLKVPFRFLGGK